MNHLDAVKGRLAEGYLLGDLTKQQRDEFEEHYFGCRECAAEVRLGAQLVANLRTALKEEELWN